MTDFILNTWAALPAYVRSTFWILVVTVVVILSVAFTTLWERKVIGWMQLRKGPNRVGSIFGLVPGIFQPFADVIKLLLKEVVIPSASNKWLFRIAPAITLVRLSQLGQSYRSTRISLLRISTPDCSMCCR